MSALARAQPGAASSGPERRGEAVTCGCAASGRSGYACPRCRARIDRWSAGAAPAQVPPLVHEVLDEPGRALDPARRPALRRHFGHDLADVRIHDGARAAASALALNAEAYTVGPHVVLGTRARHDESVLVHELAHAVQQRGAATRPAGPLTVAPEHSPSEREAEAAAAAWARREPVARIATAGAGALVQRQPRRDAPPPTVTPTTERRVGPEEPERCEGRQDITEEFSDFVRDAPSLIDAIAGLSDTQRSHLRETADWVLHTEGAADLSRLAILSCSRINLDLSQRGETTQAYIHTGERELGLLRSNAELIGRIRRRPNREDFTQLLQLVAHEKRHVTIGGAVDVDAGAVRPGRDSDLARRASYRAEEILTTAEEIAVGRLAMGPEFVVERDVQEKLYRLRNTIRNWITEEAWTALRARIIARLRARYGFTEGCDNALVIGVMSSVDRNEWHWCDRERGLLGSRVPEGLNACSGEHTPCPRTSRR